MDEEGLEGTIQGDLELERTTIVRNAAILYHVYDT